jgi:hypothetical protein
MLHDCIMLESFVADSRIQVLAGSSSTLSIDDAEVVFVCNTRSK